MTADTDFCEIAHRNEASITPGNLKLDQIIDNSYDSVLVTDKFGNILLFNPAMAELLEVSPEVLTGANVNELVKKGVYHRSTAMEAAKNRTVVTGLVKNGRGRELMSISRPLLDDNGDVVMVVTNTRDRDIMEKFIAALNEERAKTDRYRTAVEYLSELDADKVPVTESPSMRKVMLLVNVIANVDSTILLTGESGSGKEIIARYIHRKSPRSGEPFIPVNCAAIPQELLESEFFGYTRGAFTGANPQGKPGLFEIADKGTLFLDEIAELPLPMQSKLLRVLEKGEVQRLGATAGHRTNVRIIAATNRDLKQMVGNKQFRDDLYYRLNVIPVTLPPLRERPEDIIALAATFLEEFNRKYALKKVFAVKTMQAFLGYSWPGNIRELRNVIERLAITSSGDELEFEVDAPAGPKAKGNEPDAGTGGAGYSGTLKEVLKAVEQHYIDVTLRDCAGRVAEAARRLGIHRTQLYKKITPRSAKTWVAK